ncbi:hypothetical protein Fmac_029476 [Flemingia macrophylla]|uniref:Uncharacterized protein n=1 Tax=Flemingia macrophylla TaxID=520843 RepID=A0ABD1LAG5_9FABA
MRKQHINKSITHKYLNCTMPTLVLYSKLQTSQRVEKGAKMLETLLPLTKQEEGDDDYGGGEAEVGGELVG